MSTEKELKALMGLVGALAQDTALYMGNVVQISKVETSAQALEDRLRALLAELEAAREDAARVDWLEQCKEHHGFCGTGYGEYRYYAGQCDGWGSVRKTIDAARKGEA